MSRRKLPNYLRTHRKRVGLLQKELAFLLGVSGGAKVSRYEHFIRQPTLQTVFAYEVIFGVTARELFAGIFQEVEEETLRRVQTLIHNLKKQNPQSTTNRKIELLQLIPLQSRNHHASDL